MDKNLPAKAGDEVSIPGLERFHRAQGNEACEPQLLGLSSSNLKLQLLKPVCLEAVL